jgi:hypothetical protein
MHHSGEPTNENEKSSLKKYIFQDIRIVAALAFVNMIIGMYRSFGT